MIAVAGLIVWFGVRPAISAILAQPAPAPPPAAVQAARGASLQAQGASAPEAAARIAAEPAPNLIADLTAKLGRTPQKRLEQMIDFDEEQAAAILKQWIRGARA
jgi:flagellar M-ring protein FliF